jgi:hypothetical protein
MKTDVKDVLNRLPEFSEFIELADAIRKLSFRKLILEKDIKSMEATVFKTAIADPVYFVGGKTPAISFIENAFKHDGFNGEILPLREELAQVGSDLDHARLTLDIYKMMIEVYRTISANERGVVS